MKNLLTASFALMICFFIIGCTRSQPTQTIDASRYPHVVLEKTTLKQAVDKIKQDMSGDNTDVISKKSDELDIRQKTISKNVKYSGVNLKGAKELAQGVDFSFYNQDNKLIIIAKPYLLALYANGKTKKLSLLRDKNTFQTVDRYLESLKSLER